MASLKDHLLRGVASILFERQTVFSSEKCFTAFWLAGKESSGALCRMFEDEGTIVYLGFKTAVQYQTKCIGKGVLPNIIRKRIHKLSVCSDHDWLLNPAAELSKILRDSKGIRALTVSGSDVYNWPKLFEAFPSLVSVTMMTTQFIEMLQQPPDELYNLQELGFYSANNVDYYWDANRGFSAAFLALATHQAKFPSLEVVNFDKAKLAELQLLNAIDITIPTVKHLDFDMTHSGTSFDFDFLATALKIFPSLETVLINVDATSYIEPDNVNDLEHFYQSFDSLNFGFFIKVVYREKLEYLHSDPTAFCQLLATKGEYSGTHKRFTVKTHLPKKVLIREVTLNRTDFLPSDSFS